MFLSFICVASGAELRQEDAILTGSPSNVTFNNGTNASVLCQEVGVTVPSELQWYDPHCLPVSTDLSEDVHQLQTVPLLGEQGRAVLLVFKSYQESQRGKYECRVRRTVNEASQLQVLPLLVGKWPLSKVHATCCDYMNTKIVCEHV